MNYQLRQAKRAMFADACVFPSCLVIHDNEELVLYDYYKKHHARLTAKFRIKTLFSCDVVLAILKSLSSQANIKRQYHAYGSHFDFFSMFTSLIR